MRENLKTDATLEAILELVDEVLREDYQPRIERVVSRWCASPFSPDGYYAADEARDVFRAVCLGMPHKVRVKYFANKGPTTERKD